MAKQLKNPCAHALFAWFHNYSPPGRKPVQLSSKEHFTKALSAVTCGFINKSFISALQIMNEPLMDVKGEFF